MYDYCHGDAEFPIEILQSSNVDVEGIDFVKRLLTPDPKGRPTATEILGDPWPAGGHSNTAWFERLESELLSLGVTLDFGDRRGLIRGLVKLDIVRVLPTAVQENVRDLLQRALTERLSMVASALLQSPNVALRNSKPKIFHRAVEDGRIDIMEVLLANKVDVEARISGITPLQLAVGRGDMAITRMLLRNEADIDAEAWQDGGRTALQTAAGSAAHIRGSPDPRRSVRLEGLGSCSGSGVHRRCNVASIKSQCPGVHRRKMGSIERSLPICCAVRCAYIDIVRILLENKADVNSRSTDFWKEDVIHYAVGADYLDIVQLLLEYGARASGITDSPSGDMKRLVETVREAVPPPPTGTPVSWER